MPVDIRIIRVKDFLRSEVTGAVDLETSKALLRDIAAACIAHDNHYVLIDVRETIPFQISAADVWNLATTLEQVGIGRQFRIAILNAPKDDFDRAAFLETCAANQGFNIRAFRDFENALNWLAGESIRNL